MFGFKSFLQKRAEEKLRREREKVEQSNCAPSRPTFQSTHVDDAPTFAQLMLYQSMLSGQNNSNSHSVAGYVPSSPEPERLVGQGGTFDGGGSSGDWSSSSSSSCESSSYSSSDSSSSCSSSDSGSSSSSSD